LWLDARKLTACLILPDRLSRHRFGWDRSHRTRRAVC